MIQALLGCLFQPHQHQPIPIESRRIGISNPSPPFDYPQNDMVMQALWSRAAQTSSSCRCKPCLQAARRGSTAVARRRLKASDLFTACYSTILATAAVADAKMKDNRREEWDRLIEEVKSGAPMDDAKNLERIRELRGPAMPQKKTQIASFGEYERTIRKAKPISTVWDGIRWTTSPESEVTPLETQLSLLDSHLKQSLTPQALRAPMKASVEAPLQDPNQNPWNLEYEEDSEGLLPRDPKCRLHVDNMENMVARLISRLLLETKAISTLNPSSPSENTYTAREKKKLTQRIEALQSGGTRLPSFTFDDIQLVRKERTELGRSIVAIFENGASRNDSIELMVSKLCYNLLVSTSPPSINIYHTMINHFAQMRLFSLSQVIVDSFFSDSRFCANQKFVQGLLDNYASNNDRDGFQSIVRCMQGSEGNMNVKRQHISRLNEPRVQKWALQNKVIHRNGWLIQKFPRSAYTFDSLINNSLRLGDMTSAIRHFRSALREGQQINTGLICDIIKKLLDTLNWRAGLSFLRAILKQWEADNYPSAVNFSKETRFTLYQLFALCGIDQSLGSEKALPAKVSREALNNLLRYLRLESIADSIDRISACLMSVDDAFGIAPFSHSWSSTALLPIEPGMATKDTDVNLPSSKTTLVLRYHQDTNKSIDGALSILQSHSACEKSSITKRERNVVRNRIILIQVIKDKLDTQKGRMKALQFATASVSYDRLSEKYQVAYNSHCRASPWKPISSKLELLSALTKKDSAERHRFYAARDRAAARGCHNFWHEGIYYRRQRLRGPHSYFYQRISRSAAQIFISRQRHIKAEHLRKFLEFKRKRDMNPHARKSAACVRRERRIRIYSSQLLHEHKPQIDPRLPPIIRVPLEQLYAELNA